ncbi:peroxin [Umbelopsis sp. WA50703]
MLLAFTNFRTVIVVCRGARTATIVGGGIFAGQYARNKIKELQDRAASERMAREKYVKSNGLILTTWRVKSFGQLQQLRREQKQKQEQLKQKEIEEAEAKAKEEEALKAQEQVTEEEVNVSESATEIQKDTGN